MKIYINCRFLTQRITGVQRFAYEIIKALDLLLTGSSVQVIGLLPNLKINSQYDLSEFKNIQFEKCGRLSGHLWEQIELPFYSKGSYLLSLCNTSPIFKLKQYATLHDVIFLTDLDSQKLWFKLWYRLIAFASKFTAKKIFTVSEFSKAEIIRLLGISGDKLVVLGNAPSLEKQIADFSIIDKLSLQSNEYFFMLGSNSKRKNTNLVARVFANNPQLNESKLVICGGEFSNLGASEKIISSNILYTGYVSDAQLVALYMNTKAFIFPSIYEGFGIPVIEAMSLGVPVLCSDIPVMREVCGSIASYFDPYCESSLVSILLNQTNSQIDHANLIQQSEKYQWLDFATKLLDNIN